MSKQAVISDETVSGAIPHTVDRNLASVEPAAQIAEPRKRRRRRLGKQAKIVPNDHLHDLLLHVEQHRHAKRDRVIVLLSYKAGLRAVEISGLTTDMITNPDGSIADYLDIRDDIAKKGSGRRIPMHPLLKAALEDLAPTPGYVVKSERGGGNRKMNPNSIVHWFMRLYKRLLMKGCSSHSGRRTFITQAARQIVKLGGSLKDVQELAGHASLAHTQTYIEGDSDVKRALVRML